jgi:stage V sporulation protein G|tara:strand:- start:119 stop:454 length:336 start_codon:yes stop_codon:yes gene_type:complete
MKISHVTKPPEDANWGKVKCYFSIEIGSGIIIPSFKLIEGANGLFVAPPSMKSEDGTYKDLVYLRKEAREEMLPLVLDAYKKEPSSGSGEPLIKPDFPVKGDSSDTTDLPF